jgi:hypothetical protein
MIFQTYNNPNFFRITETLNYALILFELKILSESVCFCTYNSYQHVYNHEIGPCTWYSCTYCPTIRSYILRYQEVARTSKVGIVMHGIIRKVRKCLVSL